MASDKESTKTMYDLSSQIAPPQSENGESSANSEKTPGIKFFQLVSKYLLIPEEY